MASMVNTFIPLAGIEVLRYRGIKNCHRPITSNKPFAMNSVPINIYQYWG